MRLDLNVVHAPDIKSKQPWPHLTWLGKQQHDLLLVDSRRIKVLCLNAKSATKKKIAKLQPHLSHLVASNVSPNGAYLVCLLESGNLLIYHKDADLLKTVPGINQVSTHKTSSSSSSKTADKTVKCSPAPLVFISSDAHCILVVIGHRQIFLWEIDQSVALSSAKQPILKGTWSCVDCEGATLPHAECKETSVHATFFRDSVLGFCCICSFVFNQRSNVQISSVYLHWLEPYHLYTASQPRFTAQWSSLTHPLSELSKSAEPVRHHGAFLSCHASDGHTLAVAINQRSPADTRVLFVSVVGSTAISVNMKGCGCQKEIRKEKTRSYWLADIAWIADNLFLACVTKQGCLTILSRLGEAVLIQSSGCSIEHEPAFFLPFHPLVTFIPTAKQRSKSFSGSTRQENLSPTSSLRSEADEKRQRYSLATHPTLPMLLVSDGYLVTVIELPSDLSCKGVVRDFLSEGRTAVNLLLERQGLESKRLRSLSSLQLKRTMNGSDGLASDSPQRAASLMSRAGQQTSTLTRDGLLSTAGSDFADYAGRFSHLEEGQFLYSDPNEMRGTRELTLTGSDGVPVIVGRAQRALLSAWGLAVSHTGEWSYRIEDLLQYTAETIVKLFSVMLQAIKHNHNDQRYVSTLYAILNIFKSTTAVLHWDITRHHGLPTTYRLIRGTVRAISRHSGHRRMTTATRSCISILQYCEKLLTNIYSLAGVHQPTLYGCQLYPYHRADIVEGALMCRESVRVRGLMEVDDHMTWAALPPEEMRGSRDWRERRQEVEGRGIVVRHSPAKRLTQTWKLLHRHLVARYQKLVQDSSTHRSRGVRRVLLLLCGVQMKLKQLGCDVSVALCDEWNRRIDAGFLRGCQYYLQGYPEEAVACWHKTVRQTTELQSNGSVRLPSNQYFPGQSYLAAKQRSQFPTTGSSILLSHSLLAITYTHLEQYNLTAALSLVDSLIECYGVEMSQDGRSRKKEAGRWTRLMRVKASFLGWGSEEGEIPPQLPCVPEPVQREAVQTLARFMSLYFTNHSLFVYPPCAARPLPPLHHQPLENGTSRTVPIYHDRISSSIRQQQLSDIWTADTGMALLLVCGLLPEAVWLARELGDWKSALMLSVMASQQMESEIVSDKDSSSFQKLCLPENLTPLVIVKEGISVILQTPLTPPSPVGGSSVKRNSSFNEQDRRGSHSLSVSGGMRRSSSMCSINEEDRIMQEQLCRSLTDMLTAATVANLDPTPWLLRNLMDRCLSLVAEFNTLVPEEFYLPAPPFYCPQPDYEPKASDPEEVLFESSLRREVNDVIQLIMLVLNSAKCSLPCARWYVQQLDLLLTLDARKKKLPAVPLPSVLVDHARFPVDLLKTGIDSQSLPQCTVELLRVFRDLCSTVWMLHSRDKLTLAVRKYQASRERSLRVKPQNNAEVAKHSELLEDILMWADNLHPFTSFLNLEEEVQDILLTAISELPPTKETVAILARHFHGNVENLTPLLQEKFRRLSTKLKRKREKSDRKRPKRPAEAGKENKRIVKYETLHHQYRYQCKLRKLAVSNRKEEIGMCELQVFEELSEKDPSKEAGDGQDAHGESQKSETASSLMAKKNPSTTDGRRDETSVNSNQADAQYPIVGSREFESSPGYLDFLETFFLVAFGKIVQDNAPFTSKPKLPLIGAYSSELRQKEFGSVVRRMSVNTKLLTVELDSSSLIQASSRQTITDDSAEVKGNLGGEVPNKFIKSRSMFHHKPNRVEEDLISLRKYGSRSSLNSFIDPSKEKQALSQKSKVELPPSKQGILQPYSSIVLNLGEAYKSKAEMLQWFGRWAERQLAVYALTPEHGDESKAVLRVRLPQQLVLNSLWLIHHLYHPDLFEVQSIPESPVTVMTAQGENINLPHNPRVQYGKSEQPLPGNLRRGQRRNNQDKADLNNEDPGADRSRKAKTKRTSKKTSKNLDTDSENEEPKERRRRSEKKARIQRNIKEKKLKEVGSKSLDEGRQEEVDSGRPRKKRQLPEVTEAHRKTSPRHLSADKEVIQQLLLRAQSPNAVKERKRKTRVDEITYSDLSDGSITTVSIVRTRAGNYQEDTVSESSKRKGKEAVRRSDHPQHSKSERVSKRGILSNKVFYYSDSNTSSTLDISSLDEAEGTTNWLVDTTKANATSPEADFKRDDTPSPQPRRVGESSKSLNLDMKDEDVKRLVREEFMRMMEKNKSNSVSLAERNLPKNPASPDSPQPLGAKEPRIKSDAVQSQHQQPVGNERPSKLESIGQSGTTAPQPVDQGIDVETQAPSPLMQTWHGDGRVQSSLHRDQPPQGASQDTRRDFKSTGVGPNAVNSEQASTGLSQSEPVQSTGFKRSDFRPGLHSTPHDARNTDIKSTVSRRLAPLAGDDEPLMSPLSLEDLEGKDEDDVNPYAHHTVQPRPVVDHTLPTNADSTHPTQDFGNRPDGVPPTSYQSTFRFAMQVPLLLTVPQGRLAQGALGTAGVRYPPPPQGIDPSQSAAPSPTSRGVRDDRQQHHNATYQRNAAPYNNQYSNRAEPQVPASVVPKTVQTTQVNHSFIPPLVPRTGYENPVRHLVSLLHPGNQQYSGSSLPPIPLLRMEPRHPAPIIPPPRYPLVPTLNPTIPGNSLAKPYRDPVEPVPLLQLKTDAKTSQFVPLEELSAFERKQRQETAKHPAVRAREMRERIEGGKEEEGRGPEKVAPIPLLHAELRNDLNSTTRQRRRQQDKKPLTNDTLDMHPGDTPDARTQNTRDSTRLPKDRPHPGDKQQSRREDIQQKTEEDGGAESKETGRVKRGTKAGRDNKVKTRVILVESTKEEEASQDTSEKQEQSSEVEETDSDEQDEKEAKDATMRREELGNGYAIKPGSFDAMLQDRDARSVIPTAAQVHYDTVRQLQAKPKSDASTSTKYTKSVSTSMGKDDFPHHPPTVADATSQYTTAATGLADTGQIVAPDIFFNLRFGSTTSEQQPSLHAKEMGKDSVQASKGRSFISVVDVDLKDLPNLEPLPKDRQPPPSLPPHQAAPPTKVETPDILGPSPTNVELHYNALFLKDAHPKKIPPKVQFDDEAEMGGGPDAVTLKILDRQTRGSSRQVAQSKALSESARQSTKEKLNQRLAQMDQQLNAIEESAANIEQDFRNTSLMLHTVENLADAMAPGDTRPKADYSLRGYRLPDHTDADSPGTLDAQVHDDSMRSQDSRQAEEQQEDDKDEAGMVTTVTDDEGNQTGIERAEDTALTLGISGISGVSDIIAEVIADGDASDVLKMGVSTQQQKAARKKMEQRRMTEQPGVEDYMRLSSDQIRELLTTPRTPRQDEDEDDRWPSRRKPAERSDKERKELKDWAVTKRAKSLAEYKKQREELIERELRPFHPKAGQSMGPSSLKEIKKQEGERGRKKKDMIESSHDERVQQAKALMAEMFTEKPLLPSEEAPASATKRKDRTLRDSGASEMSSRLDKRPASQIPKGTYLFVDSEAYKPRPQARSQGGVGGRADSRASRGEDFGYSREMEEEELVRGSWTGRLRSEERGARGPTSSRDLDRRNQETRESNDWRILEGITEFTDDDQISVESRAKTEPAKLYRPKPFDQVVRVQRPEVTRKQPGSVRRQKTYTEMLQEMKGETGGKKTSSQTLRAKQRLYGTKRIPGSSKAADSTTPRFTKTYSERLSDMQQKSGGMTHLRPRTRPKGVPRINTGTMSLGTFDDTPYRRQQVEGRGLHPELTPRSSTPYHERLGTLSLSGTYRGRDDVVSPAPKVGVKYKPRDREPMTYVEQLQRLSSEAPRTHRHKTAYVGPVQRETYKSPRLHSPMARHRPYPRQGQRSPGVEEFDERSGFSDLSSWNVSDEVMDILHRRDSFEGDVGAVTDDDVSIEGLEYDDYTTSVNIRELEEIASVSSGSVLSNIDWGAVDKMIADVR